VTNRIRGLLASQGLVIDLTADVPAQLEQMQLWDGSPLPPGLRVRLVREWEKAQFLTGQIHVLEAARRKLVRHSDDPAMEKVRQLLTLRGIGANSPWLYTMEFFGRRGFHNGKEIGALARRTPP
jgi:transposase